MYVMDGFRHIWSVHMYIGPCPWSHVVIGVYICLWARLGLT